MLTIGFRPKSGRAYLTTGADLQSTLTRTTGLFPSTSSLKLVFGSGVTVTGVLSTSLTQVTFNADKAVVDPIPDGDTWQLMYNDGTADVCWAQGEVTRA